MSFVPSVLRTGLNGLVFSGVMVTSLLAQKPTPTLKRPLELTKTGETFVRCYVKTVHMKWSEPYFLAHEDNRTAAPRVCAVDRSGFVERIEVKIPGATEILLNGLTARPDGTIIVAGNALDGGSRTGSFMTIIPPDRKEARVTRLWPYTAAQLLTAGDGAVWAAGWLSDDSGDGTRVDIMLRRYGKEGSEDLTVVPNVTPGSSLASVRTMIGASKNRIFLTTQKGDYIEFSLDGAEVGRYPLPKALTAANSADIAGSPDGAVMLLTHNGPEQRLFSLNRERREWVELASELTESFRNILGFDGLNLLMGTPTAGQIQATIYQPGVRFDVKK